MEARFTKPAFPHSHRWEGIEPIHSDKNFIGTGFHVGDSLIVTAAHVIVGEPVVFVGNVTADIVMCSPVFDIAVLYVPGYAGRAYTVADAKLGEPAFYRAYTLLPKIAGKSTVDQVVTAGRISSLRLGEAIGYDGGIHPGMSGGPIFNARGEVVAMGISVMAWISPPSSTPNSIMGRGISASWITAAIRVAKENQNELRRIRD